jgi:hypothetical protein
VSVLSIDTEADVLSELVNFASKRRTIGRRGYAPREHITSRAAVASGGRR